MSKFDMLSGIAIAQAIKSKMADEYHGVWPPHFGLGLMALISSMLSGFVLLMLFSFTWFEYAMSVVLVTTALLFVLMSLLLRLIQGRAALSSIKLAQVYAVLCIAAGTLWWLLGYNPSSPMFLPVLATLGIAAGLLAAVLFSSARFRQLVQYQQKVWRIRLEVLADMKNSAAR